MKKNIFTATMYVLAIVGLIITLFIVYMNIDNSFAINFAIGYVIFCIVFLLYVITLSLIQFKKNEMGRYKKKDI